MPGGQHQNAGHAQPDFLPRTRVRAQRRAVGARGADARPRQPRARPLHRRAGRPAAGRPQAHRGVGAGPDGRDAAARAGDADAGAVRRDRALRRQEPGRVGQRQGPDAGDVAGAGRRDRRPQAERQHRDQAQVHQLPAAHRVARPGRHHRHQPGARQQRRVPGLDRQRRLRLRAAGPRLVREQDLRQRPGGEHLQAVAAAGQRDAQAGRVERLRRGLDGAGVQRRRHA